MVTSCSLMLFGFLVLEVKDGKKGWELFIGMGCFDIVNDKDVKRCGQKFNVVG
jgi:hypothetical protein